MARARRAELLSLDLETERCSALVFAMKPIWMAIEDNTAHPLAYLMRWENSVH